MMKLATLFMLGALADERCLLPVDVMIVQDTTGSFVEDLPNVRNVLPNLIESVLKQNPGSWFGVTDFKDKPYRDLGEPVDFCYHLVSKLTGDRDAVCAAYGQLYASGGGDLPEAQLQALIDVAEDPAAGWRALSNNYVRPDNLKHSNMDLSFETGARLIILSTDATPHDPGDYEFYNGNIPGEPMADEPTPPKFMPPFPANTEHISPDEQCKVYDYPTMDVAAAVIKKHQINVVFLVPEIEVSALQSWRKFNEEYLHQPPAFVQYIKSDSSDVVDVVLKALSEVSDYVCNASTTTTAAPTTTTTAPTTTQATTTEATTTPTTTTTTTESTTTPTTTTTTTEATTTTTTTEATTTPTTTTTTTTTTQATTTPTTTTTEATTTTTTEATTTPTTTTTTTTTTEATTTPTTTTTTTTSTESTTTPTTATTTTSTTTAAAEVSTAGSTETTTTTATTETPTQTLSTTAASVTGAPLPTPEECPPCPAGVVPDPVCPNPPCPCPCPEVEIKLRHRPQKLHFKIENTL